MPKLITIYLYTWKSSKVHSIYLLMQYNGPLRNTVTSSAEDTEAARGIGTFPEYTIRVRMRIWTPNVLFWDLCSYSGFILYDLAGLAHLIIQLFPQILSFGFQSTSLTWFLPYLSDCPIPFSFASSFVSLTSKSWSAPEISPWTCFLYSVLRWPHPILQLK